MYAIQKCKVPSWFRESQTVLTLMTEKNKTKHIFSITYSWICQQIVFKMSIAEVCLWHLQCQHKIPVTRVWAISLVKKKPNKQNRLTIKKKVDSEACRLSLINSFNIIQFCVVAPQIAFDSFRLGYTQRPSRQIKKKKIQNDWHVWLELDVCVWNTHWLLAIPATKSNT